MAPFGVASASVRAGVAHILAPDGSTPLNSGGANTQYALGVPSGSRCPGDSAHKFFHVFSYLVRQGTDPASINFRTGVPDRGLGLIADGEYYGAINTAENTGQLVDLPNNFVWSRLTPQLLFPAAAATAVWNAGIACATYKGVVTNYWNVAIRFTAAPSQPGGFVWTVVRLYHGSGGGVPWRVIGPLLIAAAFAGLALWLYRRSHRPQPTAPPGQQPVAAGRGRSRSVAVGRGRSRSPERPGGAQPYTTEKFHRLGRKEL